MQMSGQRRQPARPELAAAFKEKSNRAKLFVERFTFCTPGAALLPFCVARRTRDTQCMSQSGKKLSHLYYKT